MASSKTKAQAPKKDDPQKVEDKAVVKVELLVHAFTAFGNLAQGTTVEIPSELAENWIANKIAKEK